MFLPFDLFLLISFSILATIDNISFNSQCADQLQRCGLLLEEFERQLHDLKNNAFRSCFPKSCIHEKVAFDECFTKSLQAVRGPLFDNPLFVQNDFLSAAEDFQSELQKCFDNGDTSLSEDHVEFNATSRDTSILLGAVFSTELEDQLWGLPNGELDKKNKELTICNLKNGNNRVFGGGISRIAPQHMAPDQLNNLTATCSLNVSELSCFKRTLDYDPQYRSLMSTKERTLLSCIQNTRLRSEANCQIMSFTKMRSCICNARQAVDSRMQSILLDCVQHSSVAQLYAALVSLSFDSSLQQQTISPTRLKPTTDATNIPPLPETSFQGEEPISLPSNGAVLTQGSIVNGQCLCACTQKYIEPSSSKLISIQSNSDFTSNQQAKAKLPVSNLPVLSPIISQQNLIGYSASSSMPWYFQPVQTALSAEAGIANGFERFFNGQPPLKRK